MDIDTVLAIAAKHANPDRADIEYQHKDGEKWGGSFANSHLSMLNQIIKDGGKYRIKPSTFTINGVEIEKPVVDCAYGNKIMRITVNYKTDFYVSGLERYAFKSLEQAELFLNTLTNLLE